MSYQREEKRITKEFLKQLLRKEFKLYYSTPYLNDQLYLHYKGFDRIENLEEFTGLKVLYLEGNGFNKIEGLDALVNLRCLYLQENLIKKIENLHMLKELVNLNLTDNCIEKIENLGELPKLQTLLLKRNRIGVNGLQDLVGLLEAPTISVLDLSDNKIEDTDVLPEIFEKMPSLAVLYFQNNGAIKNIKNYRKMFVNNIKTLKYLDDKPVFPEERRFCEAFARGGLELEREERAKYKKEQEDQHMQNHLAFRAMIERYRREAEEQKEQDGQQQGQQQDQPQRQSESENEGTHNDSSVPESQLETYNSQTQSDNSFKQERTDSEMSRQSSQQSFRTQVEINKVDLKLNEDQQPEADVSQQDEERSEQSHEGVQEDGSTFCTQKQFNQAPAVNFDELD